MADPRHGTYRDLVQNNARQLDDFLEVGIFKPVFLYHIFIFNCVPLIGLLIPRRPGTKYVRPLVYALCLGIAFDVLRHRRALLGGHGYMIGLMTAWWLVWSTTLLVFTDLEHDFMRIERLSAGDIIQPQQDVSSIPLASTENSLDSTVEQQNCAFYDKEDGQVKACNNRQNLAEERSRISGNNLTASSIREQDIFHWQPYPQKFWHRLDWSLGLLYNLRGPEWNWRAPHLGPIPRSIHAQLHSGFGPNLQTQDDATSLDARRRLKAAFITCLKAYLLLDIVKVLMMRDPYFQGRASPDFPPPFPLHWLGAHPLLIRFYRLFIGCTGVLVALNFVTSFNPIVFLGLSLAFPNASRALTAAPLNEPWIYSDTFGPFFSPILDHGLAGCWGRWWHQLFRYGFTVTAQWLLAQLPNTWERNPHVRRITHVVVAFSLSGFVHACGSYTQLADTHPFSGPFLFFFMQSFAVLAENTFKSFIYPKLPLSGTPRWLRRSANFVFVFVWLLFSGAFIADDFARGGLWLMEPIPVSLLRGLGFGVLGDGWWCWGGPWFRYWSDGTFWGSGVRVI